MKKEGHFFKLQNKQGAANMVVFCIMSLYFGAKENLFWPNFEPFFFFLGRLTELLGLIKGVGTGYRKFEKSETSLD